MLVAISLARHGRIGLAVDTARTFREQTQRLTDVTAIWVGLHCPVEVLEQRERDRGDRMVGQARGHADLVHRWGTYDLDIDTLDLLEDVLADMAALRAEGRRLLVHCHGGASRTGLVLRAWLRRTEGLSADEATARVAANWPYLGLWNASFTAALERMR